MPRGFLAIWSDVSSGQETDYLHWLTREHAAERVGVPGFEAARVLRADRPDACRYLILYDLADPAVLNGADYLARLNAPTPWSSRIMPILGNFARGGGRVVAEAGAGQGGSLLALRLNRAPADNVEALGTIAAEDRICAVRLLAVDEAKTGVPTREKALRGGDESFPGLLLIEATGEDALRRVLKAHAPTIRGFGGDPAEATVYATAFLLRATAEPTQ